MTEIIKENYFKKDNTFFTVAKTNPKDFVEKEIGDSKTPLEFLPQQKITRWDNEVNFSVRLVQDEKNPIVETVGDVVKWKGDKIEAHFYDVVSEELPEGASEFEVVLLEKPKTNVVQFTLVDKGVEYFYQPALTEQEIVDGASRPENVEGSYAIYSLENKTNYVGGKEYKCGKVGHIYRPQIEDSAGTKVWGELNIENGILSVTIPQSFLDKAVYPVRHAAGLTFGYSSAGATEWYYQYNMQGSKFTAPTGIGDIDSISAYLMKRAGPPSDAFALAIYKSSDSTLISNSLTAETWMTETTQTLKTITYSTKPSLTASVDYIIIYAQTANKYISCYYDSGATGYTSDSSPGASPATFSNVGDYKLSIYATYTASEEPTAKNISDTGAGSENISKEQTGDQKSISDSGSGAEVINILNTLLVSEGASGSDLIAILDMFVLSDTGSGADTISLLKVLQAISDTGSGADVIALLNFLAINDVSGGVDIVSVLNSLNVAENATSEENGAILGMIGANETGQGSESQAIFNTIETIEDDGLGVDEAQKTEPGDEKTVSETAAGGDLINILNSLGVTDLAQAVEFLSILNQISITDIGSVNDLVNTLASITKTDQAGAVESLNILNNLNISETATGSDVIDLLIIFLELTVSDSAVATEDIEILGGDLIEITDTASAQDLIYILNSISKSEAGAGIESLDILAELNISDSAVGDEFLQTLLEKGVFDNAQAVDIIAKYIIKIYNKKVKPGVFSKKTNPISKRNNIYKSIK